MSETAPLTGAVAGRACRTCGAPVAFQPGSDALVCAHCGATEAIEATRTVVEYDFATARQTAPSGPAAELAKGGREIECKTCGARAVVTGQATRCPFCDAPVVVEIPAAEGVSQILPESVLPFGIDQARAKELFREWMRTRWFAPNDLVKRSKAQGLDGVYLPYWTYDSQTTTSYTGQRGEHYYETEHYTDAQGKSQTRQVQKTRWYFASGTVHVDFDDVLVCGSRSLPVKLVEKLEPWDLHDLRGFDDRYLAGFTAERYAVDLEDGFQHAERRMEPRIERAIRSDIGGDEQRISSKDIRHANVRWKHLLLPLWISAFRYREEIYRVTVNARTGEVAGERPWSWIKITLFVLALAAFVFGAWRLIEYYNRPSI